MRKTLDKMVGGKVDSAGVSSGGFRCFTTEMPPMVALGLLPELLRVLAPAVGAIKDGDVSMEDDISELGPALESMAAALCGGKLRELIPQILRYTSIIVPVGEGGSPEKVDLISTDEIDKAFGGRLGALFPTVVFALEVTYKDFLGESGLLRKKAKAGRLKVSSPST